MEQARAGINLKVFENKVWQYSLLGIVGLYLLLSFTLPVTRDFLVWKESEKQVYYTLFQLMFGMTLYPIPFILLMQIYPKFRKVLDSIFNKNLVITISVGLLVAFIILTYAHVYGLWWTWMTLGVYTITILLTYLLLKGRLSPAESICAGIALVGIGIGIWEIPYQIGQKLIYEANIPQTAMLANMRREVLIELPFIFGGLCILFLFRKRGIISFNKWVWIFLTATVGLFTYWFVSGFWVEVHYDWSINQWVQHPVNTIAKIVYRASKVTLALSLVSLMLPKSFLSRSNAQ